MNIVGTEDWQEKVFKNRSGLDFKIIEYSDSSNIKIKFLDSGLIKKSSLKAVRDGYIKDTKSPSVYGVGIVGSKYLTYKQDKVKGRVSLPEYASWRSMLQRCYSSRWLEKYPTYLGCSASNNFKHYEYFYEWCNYQIGFKNGWSLDKDIIFKGNKIYSEDACVFVPNEINSAFCKADKMRGEYPIGVFYCKHHKGFVAQINRGMGSCYLGTYSSVEEAFICYKKAKESYLKALADKWNGKVDARVYEALINYQVEITD